MSNRSKADGYKSHENFLRTRNTTTVRRRMANIRSMILMLQRDGACTATTLAEHFDYSVSGIRSCMLELVTVGLVVATSGPAKLKVQSTYALIDNPEMVENHIKMLDDLLARPGVTLRKPTPSYPEGEEKTLGRPRMAELETFKAMKAKPGVHILDDDSKGITRFRQNEGDGQRDALVAALFGPSKAQQHRAENTLLG